METHDQSQLGTEQLGDQTGSLIVGALGAGLGYVVGGGDWAEDRLIPDILRAFEQKKPVIIRNPQSQIRNPFRLFVRLI